MINYLGLRNEVQVQVDRLLIAKLAAQGLHLTKRWLGVLLERRARQSFARIHAAVEVDDDLMDVLPLFAALIG